jgi:chaperonin cofactor prefoldin
VYQTENRELRGKVELLNTKTTNLERENTRLYAQVQDLKTTTIPASNNSPRIGNYISA